MLKGQGFWQFFLSWSVMASRRFFVRCTGSESEELLEVSMATKKYFSNVTTFP